ncbi:MAG: amidohydrolase [Chitinophagaceae bacterium]|nr:MAG: amidohydrolase [Chitinophagaceae bacterium]
MLSQKIRDLAALYANEFIEVRHHLHAHPELSYKEFETSRFVQQKLSALGIPFTVMADTGVVGVITGKQPSDRVIALRADMDALPITEENDVQGVLQNPAPQAIFGLHVHPGLPVGKFSFRGGQVMASADEIYITIKGKGGHAAAPHLTTDTILIASQLIVSLQQVISRNRDPFQPSVLSITSFQGGYTTNVIPSEVKLMGTFRALNEEWRFKAHELIRTISHQLVTSMGANLDLHIDVGYPTVYNNEALNDTARQLAETYMGAENVETTEMRMGAEDFGYYSQLVPGCFYRLGVGNIEKGISAGVHTPTFNIDESAIENGIGMMAWLGATVNMK